VDEFERATTGFQVCWVIFILAAIGWKRFRDRTYIPSAQLLIPAMNVVVVGILMVFPHYHRKFVDEHICLVLVLVGVWMIVLTWHLLSLEQKCEIPYAEAPDKDTW
jgi:fatty acid desaturase